MRITAQAKAATCDRILQAARRLFAQKGYESTTTRDIARAAAIATGTLFNYFPTKEAVIARLASEALGSRLAGTHRNVDQDATLEEELFALVAGGLRKLKPL